MDGFGEVRRMTVCITHRDPIHCEKVIYKLKGKGEEGWLVFWSWIFFSLCSSVLPPSSSMTLFHHYHSNESAFLQCNFCFCKNFAILICKFTRPSLQIDIRSVFLYFYFVTETSNKTQLTRTTSKTKLTKPLKKRQGNLFILFSFVMNAELSICPFSFAVLYY